MGCCDSDSVQVSKMALELKSGPMLWHKKRFFGSNWRDVHSVLYNDSSICWYKDLSRQDQDGGVVLKDAPELIAYGPYTSQVPDRPPLPDNYEIKQMLAFGVRGKDVINFFLCPNQEEVASWMAAIASTMPPPPGLPQNDYTQDTSAQSNDPPQQSMHVPQMPNQPTPPPGTQQQMTAPPYAPQQPPPQYTPVQQQAPPYRPRAATQGIPGQYLPNTGHYPPNSGQYPPNTAQYPANYRPPAYQGYNTFQPQHYPVANNGGGAGGGGAGGGGGNTTVVVQQDRPGYVSGGGGGDFAMGMLLGGAIGTAWGSRPAFGVGIGWGGGWGHGSGWNQSSHSTNVHDTDITINNYYDNDTTNIHNNLEMTNNLEIEQAPAAQPVPQQPETIVEEYAPIQDTTYDGGETGFDAGCDDYGGGGFDADYGGGFDFGGDFGGF